MCWRCEITSDELNEQMRTDRRFLCDVEPLYNLSKELIEMILISFLHERVIGDLLKPVLALGEDQANLAS